MNDLGKIAVVAGILGALLLFGLISNSTDREVAEPVPVVTEEPATEIVVLPQQTLEMLDPIYSEKAVFHDKTIRVAFQGAFTEEGVESRLPFWIHNVSDDVINILWDRCSIQLPSGNTVNVINEAGLAGAEQTISIAPAGDLFDSFIPVTEIAYNDDSMALTSNVLTEGTFTLVLAIERAAPRCGMKREMPAMMNEDGCEDRGEPRGRHDMAQQFEPGCETDMCEKPEMICKSADREIAYYTFRFVLR